MNGIIIPEETLIPGYKAETTLVRLDVLPSYYKIGTGKMNKHKIQSIDLLDEVIASNKAEQYVIKIIKDSVTYDSPDGVVTIPTHRMTDTEKRMFRRGYKTLYERDLVRRVKRGQYMLNPNALILNSYANCLDVWNSLHRYTPDKEKISNTTNLNG